MLQPSFSITPETRRAISMDELINTMNTPRQEFEYTPPAEPREQVPIPGDRSKIDPEAENKFSAETARKAGEQIAELIVTGTAGACSLIGDEKATKYKPSKGEENDLAKVWARVAEYYGWAESNPILQAVIVTGAIVIPPFRDSFADRRMKKIEEEQKRQADEQTRILADMERMREQINSQPPTAHE